MRRAIMFLSVIVIGIAACTRGSADRAGEHGNDINETDTRENTPPAVGRLVEPGERLQLVATTNILGDVASNVVGDAADLTILIPAGQNPHSYEPTPGALRIIEDAHIVFVNGLGFEEGLLSRIDTIAGGVVVPVSTGITVIDGEEHDEGDEEHGGRREGEDDHYHAEGDPHVWTDPRNVEIWVENMVGILVEADPANAPAYQRNGAAYREALAVLDEEIRVAVGTITYRKTYIPAQT